MPLGERTDQLIDVCKIKEEPNIKEEPQPIADLIEDDTDAHPSVDYSQFGIGDDIADLTTVNKVKIEVEEGIQQKNEKEWKSKSKDRNG